MTSPANRNYQTLVGAASLIVGPLLMTIGDLFHPEERLDAADQTAIIVEHASRWYAAHLLLFIGMMLFIPGILLLARLAYDRRPPAGYVARILSLIGVAAISAVFVGEMLLARFIQDGGDPAAATEFLEATQSGPVVAALGPALFAFFVGIALVTVVLVRRPGPLRWPVAVLALGAVFIMAEIVSAQVVLSMIGNALIFVGSASVAWLLLAGRVALNEFDSAA